MGVSTYSGERREEERETHHPDGTPTSTRLVPQLSTHADHIPVGHLSRTPVLPTRPLSVTPPPARGPEPARRAGGIGAAGRPASPWTSLSCMARSTMQASPMMAAKQSIDAM